MWSWILKKVLANLIDPRNSEFWTGPVNIIVMLILKAISWMVPETEIAATAKSLEMWLMAMLPYALGRLVSKAAK